MQTYTNTSLRLQPYRMLEHGMMAWAFNARLKGLLCDRRRHMSALSMRLYFMSDDLRHQVHQCRELKTMQSKGMSRVPARNASMRVTTAEIPLTREGLDAVHSTRLADTADLLPAIGQQTEEMQSMYCYIYIYIYISKHQGCACNTLSHLDKEVIEQHPVHAQQHAFSCMDSLFTHLHHTASVMLPGLKAYGLWECTMRSLSSPEHCACSTGVCKYCMTTDQDNCGGGQAVLQLASFSWCTY